MEPLARPGSPDYREYIASVPDLKTVQLEDVGLNSLSGQPRAGGLYTWNMFTGGGRKQLSEELLDLLDHILAPAKERITLPEIKKHPWFLKPLDPEQQAAEKRIAALQKELHEQALACDISPVRMRVTSISNTIVILSNTNSIRARSSRKIEHSKNGKGNGGRKRRRGKK